MPGKSSRSNKLIEFLESRLLMTAGEIVRNGSFEALIASDWATTAGAPWQVGLSGFTNYHGGTKYAFTGDASGNYINSSSGSLYQQVTIPVTSVNPTLTFWTKITTSETTTTSANDTMTVSIMDASGTVSLQPLVTLSNLNSVSTAGPHTAAGRYTFQSFALSPALIGQTVRINFAVSMNATLGSTFRVDDVGLSEPVPVTPGTSNQVVGYLPYYRQSLFAQMDLDLVTHINYFSIGATAAGALTTTNVTNANLATVVNAAHAKGVGVSITVGPASFATMAADPTARATFATNIKNYLIARNLDGVDIDWEPPATGVNQDNYGLLIDALYAELHPIGKKITAAVNPWTKEIPVAATKLMDWVNVMCYDFSYADNSTYAAATDGMLQWTYYGVAKDKLLMGDPFYGRSGTSWSNTKSKSYSAFLTEYAALNGGNYPGPDVDSFQDAAAITWYVNGIGTMGRKAAFVRDNGYGGSMIWELGQDHWDGALNYDRYSQLPILGTMAHPPAWLSAGSGTRFALVKDQNQFLMHAGTGTVSSALSTANPNLNVNVWSNARLISTASQKLGSLTIDSLGDFTVNSGADKHLYTNTLSIASGGKLDLRDNDLVVNNGDFSSIQSLVMSGYSASIDPSKTGIVSTSSQKNNGVTILALFNNALVHFTQWPPNSGNTIAAGAVVGKYTLIGDTNMDGQVTPQDYTAVDANINTSVNPGMSWFYGDTNFDGNINSTDYTAIDAALGTSTSQFPAALPAQIPVLNAARAAQFILDPDEIL